MRQDNTYDKPYCPNRGAKWMVKLMFVDKNYISDRILYSGLYLSEEAWQYISKVINEAPHKIERTGEWIKAQEEKLYCDWNMDGWFDYPLTCSYCGYDATEYGTGATSYCPSCGAKMDEVNNASN